MIKPNIIVIKFKKEKKGIIFKDSYKFFFLIIKMSL